MIMTVLIWLGCYLLGSIPFGLVLCKMAGLGDIRQIGSGNIGATNVLRTGNKKLALATFLLDTGKGALAVGLAYLYSRYPWFIWGAGLAVILGHMFPVWLKFNGGKGVATSIGTLWALSWPVGAFVCLIWVGIAYAFRISSLAALAAFLAMPGLTLYFAGLQALPFAAAMSALVYWRHRANIARLITGTETKMNFKK
jgi:glycerol-3-phosphate acyltransferase PlsY